MKLEVVKIVSAPTLGSWSQVHVFTPEGEKLQKRGEVFAVLSLKGEATEEEIAAFGKELISRFHEEYYGFLEETPFNQLKTACKAVLKEIPPELKLEIICGAVVGNVLYLGGIGFGKVVLKRGKNIAFIFDSREENFAQMASGYIQEEDIFILGTKNFFEIISQQEIYLALQSGSAQQAGEFLTPLVLGKEEGLASAIVIEVRKKEEKERRVLEKEPSEKKIEKEKRLTDFFAKIKKAIIEPPTEKPKTSYFILALILFLILGLSVVFGSRERKRQETEKKIAGILEQVKAKKEEGEAIFGLNPTKGREILKEAEILLAEVEKEKINSPEIEKTKEELKNYLNSVLREYETEVKLFFDLELIKKGATGSDFVLSDERLLVLDSQNLAVYTVGIKDKDSLILAGGDQLKDSLGMTAFGDKVYILTPQGVLEGESKIQNEKLKIAVEKDKSWEAVKDLVVFAGNLYLLDKKGIWVYPTSAGGFGEKRAWLGEGENIFEGEKMRIDGAIWILRNDGKIEKYSRGVKGPFVISGLDKEFSLPADFWTSDSEERLYVLDRGNSRIVVLNKSGEYYAQYKNPQIAGAQNLVVSEKEGKIFLLEGSKIYEIALK